MANYTKVFTKPYADGYEDLPSQNTPITAETLNDKDDTLEHIEGYLYDNPIAEVVDNLTTNDATKALSAKQGKILNETKLNVADLPNSEVQTSDDGQFTTVTGGLMQSCVVELEPIQSGSGTPSPSNVRTISGHTQVQVGNCGKNKCNPDTFVQGILNHSTGAVDSNDKWITSDYIPISGTVTLSGYKDGTEVNFCVRFIEYDANKEFIGSTSNINVTDVVTWSKTITLNSNTRYARTTVGFNNKVTTPSTYFATNRLQIEEGSQATEYEPYKGYTTTINLGGTYYGGTLDAVSGKFTVTHKYTDITSFAMRNRSTANKMFITNPISDARKPSTNMENVYPISNRFSNSKDYDYLYGYTDVGIAFNTSGNVGVAFGSTSEIDTLEKANTWLSSNPLQLVYELATPQTIQLDPQTLETLVGQNDVFAPLVGQSVESVEYREVFAIDDVPKAIPYECVDPIQVDWFTIFKIHRYGRVVVLKFDDLDATPVVSEDGWAILGRLPERFYHKYPNQMVAQNMIFGVINDDAGTLQMKKLIIDQYNGDVKIYFLANEQIKPLGSITYILDHD